MNMNKKLLLLIIFVLLLVPSYKVEAAREKNVTVNCYCRFDDSGEIVCPDDCTNESVEEAIKIDCGGRNSNITSEVKYYCNRRKELWIPIRDYELSGSSPLEACQNYRNNITSEEVPLKVTARAKCEQVREGLGEFICEEKEVLTVISFAGYILFFVKLLVPFIIILMGTMDFYKTVVADKEGELNTSVKKFVNRIILGVIVFFIPTILNAFMSLLSDRSETIALYEQCVTCILDPISCNN